MTDPIRWGVLGASRFALDAMAPAIHAARGATLHALATRDPGRAAPFAALAPGLRVHAAYDALLADPEVDAVYVPLPHTMHVEWGLRALAAGKPVLVEKPLAMTAAAIDPLIAARDGTGLPCAEAYMIVHHPQWTRVRALLAEGAIGPLRHVEGMFAYSNAHDPGNIRNRADTGGGALPDVGVYPIGATRWAIGDEPEILHAAVDWEGGCDVLSRVSARFDGVSAHWVVSMRLQPEQSMLFHGERGLLKLSAPFNPGHFGEATLEWRTPEATRVERWPAARQYVAQVEAFGAAIRGDQAFPWTLEDARGTQVAIDAAIAAAGGRPAG